MLRRSMIAFCVFCFGLLASVWTELSFAQDQGKPNGGKTLHVKSVQDVLAFWHRDQHLYVKGDIGVASKQLDALEQWLDENGKHWTVVLMQNAEGESYRLGGESYVGVDAVEYALDHGLTSLSDFGALEHPLTNETDGAIFALFLEERNFSLLVSDAQDNRNLGKSHWPGELDQAAVRAMRSGGRIVDAVKDTIKLIDGRLARSIQQELEAQRQREDAIKLAVEESKQAIGRLRAEVSEIERLASALRDSSPSASGALAKPTIDTWNTKLDHLLETTRADNVRQSEKQIAQLANEVNQYLNSFADREGMDEQLARIEAAKKKLKEGLNNAAQANLVNMDQWLDKAQQAFRNGDLDLVAWIEKIDQEIQQGQAAIDREVERVEQEAYTNMWIRRTIMAVFAVILVSIGGILTLLNRKRKPVMIKAKEELAAREASVRKETDDIDRLFTRNTDILGSRDKVTQRGYEGKTREVAFQALDYVDDLFIFSKEVRRVLAEAKELVSPSSVPGKLMNLFSGSRFEQAINLVTGKPLRFQRSAGLPLALRDFLKRTRRAASERSDTGNVESPEDVYLTFEEAFQAFKDRGDEAETALTRMESSLTNIQDKNDELINRLKKLHEIEGSLQTSSSADGYFASPNLLSVLLPSIQEDAAKADQLAAFNAVEAMEDILPSAMRKVDEAEKLSAMIQEYRASQFAILEHAGVELKKLGYSIDWIDAALDELSSQANDLFAACSKQSMAESITSFGQQLVALTERAKTSLEQAGLIHDKLQPRWTESTTRVESTLHWLASQLKLEPNQIYQEAGKIPGEYLKRAQRSLDAARAVLMHGKVDAAAEAIDVAKVEMDDAHSIMDASVSAVENRSTRVSSVESLRAKTLELARVLQIRLESSLETYARSSMLLRYSSGALMDGPPISADVDLEPRETQDHVPAVSAEQLTSQAMLNLGEVQSHQSQVESLYNRGSVLKAWAQLEEAEELLADTSAQLSRTDEHLRQLETKAQENEARQADGEVQLQRLVAYESDDLVTRATLQKIELVDKDVRQNRRAVDDRSKGSNPFEVSLAIASVRKNMEDLQSEVLADQRGHAEASRAVAGAIRQLETAKQLVRQSQSDRIPDSDATTQINQQVNALESYAVQLQRDLRQPHGDWKAIDRQAAKLQSDLSLATQSLSAELQSAAQALQAFQQASQDVYRAENWSGPWGLRVSGSPGVRELERARAGLERGEYSAVLEVSRLAAMAAAAAIQQIEREVARRRMEEQRAAEQARRAREAAMRPTSSSRSFGTGVGTFGSSSSSRSSSSSSRPSSTGTRFGRSGW